MLKFALLFVLYLVVLFVLELLAPVDRALIQPWTAFLAHLGGIVMRLVDSSVVVYGNVIAGGSAGFAIAIERGCNGIEAVIILIAAMLAYPASWRQRLIGIGSGTLNPATRNAGLQLAPRHSSTLAALRSLAMQIGTIVTVSGATAIVSASAAPGVAQAWAYGAIALVLVVALPVIARVPEHRGAW